MAIKNNPPILPLRPSDDNSQFLAKDLLLAYPMLEGGDAIKNYGTLGAQANLSLNNVTRVKQNGLASLSFNGTSSIASSGAINVSVPQKWSFAYWVKFNSAPAPESSLLTLQGPTEEHLRAWADSQGIWAWQKHSIADAYSILPTSDFPTNNTMLVIAVYDDPILPPVQLRTNQGLTAHPAQPQSYTAFNEATGAPLTTVNGIYLGGGPGNSKLFNGILGPVYVWSRPLSESEIWQLWQDPYAPFRRNTEQVVAPSTMVSSQGASLQGIGKLTGTTPIINDDTALHIRIDDYLAYNNLPNDLILNDIQLPNTITVTDSMYYRNIPTDYAEADAPYSLYILNVTDNINYRTTPTDTFIESESGTAPITSIIVNESLNYASVPVDSVIYQTDIPQNITVNEDINYRNTPTETVTITLI